MNHHLHNDYRFIDSDSGNCGLGHALVRIERTDQPDFDNPEHCTFIEQHIVQAIQAQFPHYSPARIVVLATSYNPVPSSNRSKS